MKDMPTDFERMELDGLPTVNGEKVVSCIQDTGRFDRKCLDPVELSNVCREFYQARKQAAADVKAKLATSGRQRVPTTKKPSTIDVAMETLKTEMASLMDQDLSLMKQLLTLNETIEDLKWQRQLSLDQSSSISSSCDLSMPSDWLPSSETDTGDVMRFTRCKSIESTSSDCRGVDASCRSARSLRSDCDTDLQFEIDIDCRSDQSSYDSGIHENIASESFA